MDKLLGIYIDNVNVPWMEHIYRLAEKTNIALFVNNYGNIDVKSRIAILPSYFIWNFRNPIIAGDTFSARFLAECPIPSRKLFYISHIDWSGFMAKDSIKAASLELITEPELAQTVQSVWKKPEIARNWNYEQIQRILGS